MNVETTFSQQDSNLDAQFANNGESFGAEFGEVFGITSDTYILEGSMNAIANGSAVVRLYKNGQPCTDRVYLVSEVSSGGAAWSEHGTSTGWLTTEKTWSFDGTEDGMAWRFRAYADSTRSKLLASCFISAAGKDGNDYVLSNADKAEIAERAATLVKTGGADWNAAEGEPGHVENRTHWVGRKEVTVECAQYDYVILEGFPAFAAGDTLTVKADGVEQSIVVVEDNGALFAYSSDYTWMIGYDPTEDVIAFSSVSGTHTLTYEAEAVHTLDKKFLPDDFKAEIAEQAAALVQTPLEEYADADARARFIDAMEEKASKMGLNITISGPAGYPDNNYSDGKSMAKLYTVANGYHELSKIWNASTKVLHTKDVVSTINLYSSVFYTDSSHFASDLTNHYFMHGGKTGTTGSSNRLLGCIMKAPDDRQFTAWLTTKAMTESTGNNRHACMKLLMDIAYAKYKDPNADVSTIEAQMVEKGVTSAVVMLVPQTANLLNYERFDFFETEMTDGEVANATLDAVAWGGKTYREIFLNGNMFADVSAITEANNSGWAQYSNLAKPTPTTSQYNTSPNAWNCSGTQSVQMSKDLSLTNGNTFYIACKRRLASYTAGGWLGVEVYYIGGAGKVISDTVNASSVSETFETVSHTFTPKTATTQFWIGSGGSANLTGYIDDVVCVNMTELFGTNVPSKEQMNTLYENFLKIYKGEPISGQVERYKYEYPVYEYQASNRVNIASNTKVLTAITALDYIDNLDEWITIKASDIQSGSGPVFKGGERMTMRDALYALMLPSSNTCAYAIARVIGNKLLNLDEA